MQSISEEIKENTKEKPIKQAISIYITLIEKEKLDTFCKENKRNRSDVISYLISKL